MLAAYQDEMTGRILRRVRRIRATRAEDAVQRAMQICGDWVEQDIAMSRIVVAGLLAAALILALLSGATWIVVETRVRHLERLDAIWKQE